jgi:hypothetical protein
MRSVRLLMGAASAAAIVICAPSPGLAGGSSYQIAFSNNCNNPSVCFQLQGSRGGDWGSIQLNADGTGTAEFTTAQHQTAGLPNGAQHFHLVLSWSALASPSGPPAGAITADPNANYLVITVVNIPSLGSLITPATPGHYKFQGAQLGMPGVNYMLQINQLA